jgi:hypothetical protein
LVVLDEIFYGDDVQGDIDSIPLNLVASTIPKWRMFTIEESTIFEALDGFG